MALTRGLKWLVMLEIIVQLYPSIYIFKKMHLISCNWLRLIMLWSNMLTLEIYGKPFKATTNVWSYYTLIILPLKVNKLLVTFLKFLYSDLYYVMYCSFKGVFQVPLSCKTRVICYADDVILIVTGKDSLLFSHQLSSNVANIVSWL